MNKMRGLPAIFSHFEFAYCKLHFGCLAGNADTIPNCLNVGRKKRIPFSSSSRLALFLRPVLVHAPTTVASHCSGIESINRCLEFKYRHCLAILIASLAHNGFRTVTRVKIIMGCGSSSIGKEEEEVRSASTVSHRERERQRLLAINRERPMAWLFQYPEPHSPAPSDRMKRNPASMQSSRSYSMKNSRGFSTQNSRTSEAATPHEPEPDPYLPGPYIQPMQPLHVTRGRSRG